MLAHARTFLLVTLAGGLASFTQSARADCPPDVDHDGFVTGEDFDLFQSWFVEGDAHADYNNDGFTNGDDFDQFVSDFVEGCPTQLPDLVITDILTPTGLAPGQIFDLPFVVKNTGNVPAGGAIPCSAVLSLDCVRNNGNDVFLGRQTLDIPGPLAPGESVTLTLRNLQVPTGVALGEQRLIVTADDAPGCGNICELDEDHNTGCERVTIAFPEVAITQVSAPPTVTSGELVRINFTITNQGPGYALVPVNACVCGSCASSPGPIVVGPYSSVSTSLDVVAPPSQGDCGQPDPCTVTVCANYADSIGANNCRSQNVSIIDQYWDLALDVKGPTSIPSCPTSPLHYTVTVTNNGNITSQNVPLITGLVGASGPGAWTPTPRIVHLNSGNIPAKGSQTFSITYPVCGLFCPTTQYWKAEVNYSGGGSDLCNAIDSTHPFGTNFDQQSVQVHCGN